LYFRGAERDECCEDTPLDGVFEFELGSEFRSVSIIGGLGDLDGLECRLIAEGEREEGNEDSEVLRFAGALPLELQVAVVSVVPVVPLVVGRCMAALVAFVLRYIGTVEAMVIRCPVLWTKALSGKVQDLRRDPLPFLPFTGFKHQVKRDPCVRDCCSLGHRWIDSARRVEWLLGMFKRTIIAIRLGGIEKFRIWGQ